jgi:hypothetical protein
LLVANPDITSQVVSASFPSTGLWYDYFSGKSFEVKNTEAKMNLLPGEFHLLTNVSWNTTDLGLVPWSVPDFNILGVEEVALKISMYPNPSKEFVKIEWQASDNGEASFFIIDTNGREITQKNIAQVKGKNTYSFTTSNLSKGLYFIQLNNQQTKLVVE